MGLFSSYAHAKALRELREQLDECERTIKKLEREMGDLDEYVTRMVGRISKRAAAAERAEREATPTPPAGALPADGGREIDGRLWSPEQRDMQARILQRRSRVQAG